MQSLNGTDPTTFLNRDWKEVLSDGSEIVFQEWFSDKEWEIHPLLSYWPIISTGEITRHEDVILENLEENLTWLHLMSFYPFYTKLKPENRKLTSLALHWIDHPLPILSYIGYRFLFLERHLEVRPCMLNLDIILRKLPQVLDLLGNLPQFQTFMRSLTQSITVPFFVKLITDYNREIKETDSRSNKNLIFVELLASGSILPKEFYNTARAIWYENPPPKKDAEALCKWVRAGAHIIKKTRKADLRVAFDQIRALIRQRFLPICSAFEMIEGIARQIEKDDTLFLDILSLCRKMAQQLHCDFKDNPYTPSIRHFLYYLMRRAEDFSAEKISEEYDLVYIRGLLGRSWHELTPQEEAELDAIIESWANS